MTQPLTPPRDDARETNSASGSGRAIDIPLSAAVVDGLIEPTEDVGREQPPPFLPCVKCGHDLAGRSAPGVCPECGAAYDALPSPKPPAPSKHPLRELLQIAAPTVATMTSYTMMTFADKLIVSRIGPEPIYVGAQGNGGLVSWVPISLAIGTITVINTYVSQNLGAGRPERAPAYAWNGLWIAAAFWLVFLIPYGVALPWVLEFALIGGGGAHDPAQHEMARMATQYGQVLIFGAVLTMSTRALSQFFYGMHRAGVVLIAGVVANALNIVLAIALVFGLWGFPRLGVVGSAYATLIATAVELVIPMSVFLGPTFNRLYRTRSQWMPSVAHARDIFKIGWPGGLMFGNEMICWGYFMVHLVSHFGKEHASAGWIAHQYMSLSFMPAVGMSVACTALVGKYMGMGRPDLAAKRAWLAISVTMVYMVTCGVLFIVLRAPMIALFLDQGTPPDVAARVVALGSSFLIATATFQAFDAVAMICSGGLRGAGDTVVPGIVTVALAWTVIVGGGTALVHYAPQLESLGPWMAAASYIIALSLFLLFRFVGGRWKKIRLLEQSAGVGH